MSEEVSAIADIITAYFTATQPSTTPLAEEEVKEEFYPDDWLEEEYYQEDLDDQEFEDALQESLRELEAVNSYLAEQLATPEFKAALATAPEESYQVQGGNLFVYSGEAVVGTDGEVSALVFEIVGEAKDTALAKGLIKVGKYVVKAVPQLRALSVAVELGFVVYEQKEEILAFAKKVHDAYNKAVGRVPSTGSTSATGGPDWEPDDNFDREKVKYEDAPYHHKNSNGLKSPNPENGLDKLRESIRVKSTSNQRIFADKSKDEFTIFMKHLDNTYHGHVKAWEGLSQEQKNALIKAGKANPNGKIF